jgi:hypothetical protein
VEEGAGLSQGQENTVKELIKVIPYKEYPH